MSFGLLYNLFETVYSPFLMKKAVRAAVVILFFGWACSSIAVVPRIEIGRILFTVYCPSIKVVPSIWIRSLIKHFNVILCQLPIE